MDRNTIECNGRKYSITYKYEKRIVWAITYINGQEIKKYGDSEETAYWAMQQAIYQVLNFRI